MVAAVGGGHLGRVSSSDCRRVSGLTDSWLVQVYREAGLRKVVAVCEALWRRAWQYSVFTKFKGCIAGDGSYSLKL